MVHKVLNMLLDVYAPQFTDFLRSKLRRVGKTTRRKGSNADAEPAAGFSEGKIRKKKKIRQI